MKAIYIGQRTSCAAIQLIGMAAAPVAAGGEYGEDMKYHGLTLPLYLEQNEAIMALNNVFHQLLISAGRIESNS